MAGTKGVALVTGASSGIGLELARCFAKDGHALIITSDDGSELERAARELQADSSAEVAVVVADLADPAGPERLYESVRRSHGTAQCFDQRFVAPRRWRQHAAGSASVNNFQTPWCWSHI